MAPVDSAFASFERKWLNEFPENAMVAVFLPAAQRQRANAFGTLIHELTQTAFYRSDPQIALTKLAWWRQELIDARAGSARHPITLVLFADTLIQASDPSLWPALVDAALEQVDLRSGTDVAQLLEQFRPWHACVARADAAVFSLQATACDDDASLWVISYLLRDLAGIPARADAGQLQHAVLPLDLLARHGIARADLSNPGTARTAFVRDYLATLLKELDGCREQLRPRSLPRRVRTMLDRKLILQARRASDPLAWLAAHQLPGPGRSLWVAWREARHSGVG